VASLKRCPDTNRLILKLHHHPEVRGIVQSLLQSKPMKREKVKIAKKKPAKLIPPQTQPDKS
jgi:hypothetical protein